MYTQMLPAMMKMFIFDELDMQEFWTNGYKETNFYDYSIYEDDYEQPEYFEQFDQIDDLHEFMTASYMGELLMEDYYMDVYLFLD